MGYIGIITYYPFTNFLGHWMALEARWFLEATESRKQFRESLIWLNPTIIQICMLLLRDVFYNDALFGLMSHNHPCVCFRESRSSLNFNLSWVSQLFVGIQRQPRVWGLGGLGRGRLVVWNPRIRKIAPTKQKHPEFRIPSPEVDCFLQNSTSGIFWHPWLWGGMNSKCMDNSSFWMNMLEGGTKLLSGKLCWKMLAWISRCHFFWHLRITRTSGTEVLPFFSVEGVFFLRGGGEGCLSTWY